MATVLIDSDKKSGDQKVTSCTGSPTDFIGTCRTWLFGTTDWICGVYGQYYWQERTCANDQFRIKRALLYQLSYGLSLAAT